MIPAAENETVDPREDWDAAARAMLHEAIDKALDLGALERGAVDEITATLGNGWHRCWFLRWREHQVERELRSPPCLTEGGWERDARLHGGDAAKVGWSLREREAPPWKQEVEIT